MKSIVKFASAFAAVAFVSTSALAELIVPVYPVYPVEPAKQVYKTKSGVETTIALPAEVDEYGRPVYDYDEYGRRRLSPTKLTHFEIVVGPGSTARGCVPASKADGYKSFTGVNALVKDIEPTTLIDTVDRVENSRETWKAYQFEVNGATETPVQSIVVFFPFNKRHGRVDCMFQLNLELDGGRPQYAAPAGK